MGELRRDPIIGQWVVVNAEKPLGPDAYPKEKHILRQAATCQFCYGKEQQTPPEAEAIRDDGSAPDTPGWTVRVVPNKFPALSIEGDVNKHGRGIYDMSNGIGAHEVLIETPDHGKNFADLTVEEIYQVLGKYQSRIYYLAQDKRMKYIMIFRNYGDSAGASVEHPHSQIIALPMVPKAVVRELEGSKKYYGFRGRCVFCDMIEQEIADGERIVAQNEEFVSFCPFAPRESFETWILPRQHSSRFTELSDEQKYALAAQLKEVLSRIKGALSDPSYNYYLHIAPVNYEQQESYHWHIEIVPALTRDAGFEWGTGFHLVQTSPRAAANYLRAVKI